MKIGEQIKRLRKERNMTQEQLAEKIGISTTHMSHIETGSTKLSLTVLVDLAVNLKVKTDCLLFNENNSTNEKTIKLLEQAILNLK